MQNSVLNQVAASSRADKLNDQTVNLRFPFFKTHSKRHRKFQWIGTYIGGTCLTCLIDYVRSVSGRNYGFIDKVPIYGYLAIQIHWHSFVVNQRLSDQTRVAALRNPKFSRWNPMKGLTTMRCSQESSLVTIGWYSQCSQISYEKGMFKSHDIPVSHQKVVA